MERETKTIDRFYEYAQDAPNWGGTPLVGGNVGGDAADKGFLVNMKKRGWITTFETTDGDNGCEVWIEITDEGRRVYEEERVFRGED